MDKDSIYLEVAETISKLSKDKGTKVGAVIIASDGTPVSFGYNGTLRGADDNLIPLTRDKDTLELEITESGENGESVEHHKVKANKYSFTYHAEDNAIFYSGKQKLIGSTLYVTYIPCAECAKEIVRAKIARVVCPKTALASPNVGSKIGDDFDEVLAIFATGNVQLKVGDKEYKVKITKKESSEDESGII